LMMRGRCAVKPRKPIDETRVAATNKTIPATDVAEGTGPTDVHEGMSPAMVIETDESVCGAFSSRSVTDSQDSSRDSR
jgi:hypothetical protein